MWYINKLAALFSAENGEERQAIDGFTKASRQKLDKSLFRDKTQHIFDLIVNNG